MDSTKFLPLFNGFLETSYADTLTEFAETYCREFRRMINDQVVSGDLETHQHRYHELFHVFKTSTEKALQDWCDQKQISRESFEASIDKYVAVPSDDEGVNFVQQIPLPPELAENPRSPNAVQERQMRETDRTAKRLLKGFLAATEYKSFMEFMFSYVAEMDESEPATGAEEELDC